MFVSPTLRSQELLYKDQQIGFNFSANIALGSHFDRIGLNIHFFYINNHFQANSELRAYFNLKNLGPKYIHPELVLAQGLVFAYGRTQAIFNPFITSVSNQTKYSNAVSYSFNAYFNNIKTTQQTGIAAFTFGSVSVITENDLLARPMHDRFRTAAFLVQYQFKNLYQAAVNCTMWTGKMGVKHGADLPGFYHKCYMDTTGALYANRSHGLLSAQVKYNVGYSQNAQLNLGADAEQVRNAVQNKFIHNMRFLPKKWNQTKNCHIPMLDENENQYLYRDGQKIRKPKLYWNLYSNANVFY